MTLTKEQILNADDLKRKEVDVPEWGGTVLLRELTGRERDSFEEGSLDRKTRDIKMTNMRARLVAMSAIDDLGERLFTQAEANELGGKSAAALNRCFEVSCSLSGITETDVEALEGNTDSEESVPLGSTSLNS